MFGFVYIWRDSFRQMYYVGSHKGSEEDGYVSSSSRMNAAYKRRPSLFKRRILSRIYTNMQDLRTEERRWLQMMKPQELGSRYYNFNREATGFDVDLARAGGLATNSLKNEEGKSIRAIESGRKRGRNGGLARAKLPKELLSEWGRRAAKATGKRGGITVFSRMTKEEAFAFSQRGGLACMAKKNSDGKSAHAVKIGTISVSRRTPEQHKEICARGGRFVRTPETLEKMRVAAIAREAKKREERRLRKQQLENENGSDSIG